MRTLTRGIVGLSLAAALVAASPVTPNPAWAKLETLVGNWKGTYAGPESEGSGEVRISYRLVSNGTALEETLDSGHDTSMITMYAVDGRRILATHYCAMGNQPRLAASGLSADGKTLTFSFVDAANAAGPDAELMKGLVVTFQDADHFTQAWTSRMAGKDQVGTFTYTRVR
jgi:hypothetical protein